MLTVILCTTAKSITQWCRCVFDLRQCPMPSPFPLTWLSTTYLISAKCHDATVILLNLADTIIIILLSTCLFVLSMWAMRIAHGFTKQMVPSTPSLDSVFTTACMDHRRQASCLPYNTAWFVTLSLACASLLNNWPPPYRIHAATHHEQETCSSNLVQLAKA